MSIVDKMRKHTLRWFRHMMKTKEIEAVRMVIRMNIEGKRAKGRPKYIIGNRRPCGVKSRECGRW